MRTVDRLRIRAPVERAFQAAADVERWPEWLGHYRSVRFTERRTDGGRVRMSAVRPFGLVHWPVWWESEMWVEPGLGRVRYRHVQGITAGMDVVWQLAPVGEESEVTIVHEWDGPAWPLIRRPAADWVIGPVFIHGIASRTLAGIARALEAGHD
jgi:coenzyme Q-binding protein COQ10